jgi:hypothetical protein
LHVKKCFIRNYLFAPSMLLRLEALCSCSFLDYLTGAFVGAEASEAQTSSLSFRAKMRWPE